MNALIKKKLLLSFIEIIKYVVYEAVVWSWIHKKFTNTVNLNVLEHQGIGRKCPMSKLLCYNSLWLSEAPDAIWLDIFGIWIIYHGSSYYPVSSSHLCTVFV